MPLVGFLSFHILTIPTSASPTGEYPSLAHVLDRPRPLPTPLPGLEKDDADEFVPIWKQDMPDRWLLAYPLSRTCHYRVQDEKGHRRLHGTFAGGFFSAGTPLARKRVRVFVTTRSPSQVLTFPRDGPHRYSSHRGPTTPSKSPPSHSHPQPTHLPNPLGRKIDQDQFNCREHKAQADAFTR